MKLIFYKTILIVFLTYWLITIFYILPKNPLNIYTLNGKEMFESNFFQRWSFFAPPPTFNDRIYIIYKNKETNYVSYYEILTPVFESKSANAPFNTYYQIQDYIINSSISNIEESIKLFHDILTYEKNQQGSKISDSLITNKIVAEIEKTNDFKTLKNYAKIAAQKNKMDLKKITFQIQFYKVFIPQFIDRYKNLVKEEISFSSNSYNFQF